MSKSTLVITACLTAGFIGTFLLRATMPSYKTVELLLILGALFLSLITILGVAVRAQWGYKLSTLLFTLGIANATLLYQWTGKFFLTYALTLLFLTLGLIVSTSRIGTKEEEEQSQVPSSKTQEETNTQDLGSQSQVTSSKSNNKKTGKRGRKKKTFNPRTDMKVFEE